MHGRSRARAVAFAGLVGLGALACDGDRVVESEDLWQLDLVASELDPMTGLGVDCRMVAAVPQASLPITLPWTATLDFQVQRRALTGGRFVTVEATHPHRVALETIDPDRVRLLLDGVYADTLSGRSDGRAGFTGDWSCDGSFPFAGHADLVAVGYDSATVVQGSWAIFEIGPSG